jgi:hypothetical protein
LRIESSGHYLYVRARTAQKSDFARGNFTAANH